jgi:hypothetical protein
MITETGFIQIHRANTAEHILIYFIGGIKHFVTSRGFTRNVIYRMD